MELDVVDKALVSAEFVVVALIELDAHPAVHTTSENTEVPWAGADATNALLTVVRVVPAL